MILLLLIGGLLRLEYLINLVNDFATMVGELFDKKQ